MSDPTPEYDPLHRHHWGWKVFQLAVWGGVAYLVSFYKDASVGLMVVMGGMAAWYSTGIVNGIFLLILRVLGKPIPQRYQRNEGQLDAWLRDVKAREQANRRLPEDRSP